MTTHATGRLLAIHFPNWPIQRLLNEQPERRTQPVVLYGRIGRQARCVWACNELATSQGISVGMPLMEARRHFAGYTAAIEQVQDEEALEALAVQCQRFTPYCGTRPADPYRSYRDTILLDITKTAKLFGGEAALGQQIWTYFHEGGYQIQAVIASNWAVARGCAVCPPSNALEPMVIAGDNSSWLASIPYAQECKIVDALPVAAMRLPPDVRENLKELGLDRVEHLRRLPIASLPARFGTELPQRLHELDGLTTETIQVSQAETTYHAGRNLEHPTRDLEVLQLHVESLLEEVLQPIVKRQAGVLSLICQWFSGQGAPRETTLRLVQPVQSERYLLQLLQLQWERINIAHEVTAVHVLVPLTTSDKPQQQWLFQDQEEVDSQNRAELIDRLSSRLGPEQVIQMRWQAQALPERSFVPRKRMVRQAKGKTQSATHNSFRCLERPSRLFAQPRRLQKIQVKAGLRANPCPVDTFSFAGQQFTVVQAVGPERIESQWWEGRWVRRDYYRVHTDSGQRFWIFQEIGTSRWWLHGDFA